jgi:hypothetical protein
VRGFEKFAAFAIGWVTLTGAVLAYLALQVGGQAAGADKQAVNETIVVQQNLTAATLRALATSGLAGQYRWIAADAAVAGRPPDEAWRDQAAAQGFLLQSGIAVNLSGTGATATFDDDAMLALALHDADYLSLPLDQPDRTARTADALHAKAMRVGAGVEGMVAVIVLLTLARLAPRSDLQRSLAVAGAAGYAGSLIWAVVSYL